MITLDDTKLTEFYLAVKGFSDFKNLKSQRERQVVSTALKAIYEGNSAKVNEKVYSKLLSKLRATNSSTIPYRPSSFIRSLFKGILNVFWRVSSASLSHQLQKVKKQQKLIFNFCNVELKAWGLFERKGKGEDIDLKKEGEALVDSIKLVVQNKKYNPALDKLISVETRSLNEAQIFINFLAKQLNEKNLVSIAYQDEFARLINERIRVLTNLKKRY